MIGCLGGVITFIELIMPKGKVGVVVRSKVAAAVLPPVTMTCTTPGDDFGTGIDI